VTKITTNPEDIDIRLLEHNDIKETVRIEAHSFEYPWKEVEFKEYIGDEHKQAYTAKINKHIIGYIAYEKIDNRRHIRIRNIAVDPILRRLGVGIKLMDYIFELYRLDNSYDHLVATIRETNLRAQLFFKKCQFKCIKIINDYYTTNGVDEPAYLMKRILKKKR
jgi:[ribosomal protein S18]-alanine N-acetyltransferase